MKTRTLLAAAALLAFLPARAAEPDGAKPRPYPLDTCLVSGEKLGTMGKPYVFTYEGREIRFCCKGCMKDFKKDPAKYLKKLDDAAKAAADKAAKPAPDKAPGG